MGSQPLQFISHPKPLLNPPTHQLFHPKPSFITLKCTSNPKATSENPNPEPETEDQSDGLQIERRRRKSEIIRDKKQKLGLAKAEPPNFEIGWKRTKELVLEQPKGYMIADFLDKLEGLMGREFGSTELLAKTGELVAERVREEAEVLREEGEVEERLITELFRVLRLMEMDLAMVKAAVKEETLNERLEQAKSRCSDLWISHVHCNIEDGITGTNFLFASWSCCRTDNRLNKDRCIFYWGEACYFEVRKCS